MITTVVIPVLNRYDLLERCVASIPAPVRNVLVIDNGDSLGEDEFGPNVRVLRMPTNLGVPVSWNLGIKAHPHEPGWVLLNSDAYFSDHNAFTIFARDCAEDRVVLGGNPPWCCAWIGAGVVARVGLFCEAFYPAYMEDVDYEARCKALGVPIVRSAAPIHHDNSATIRGDDELRHKNDLTHRRNLDVFNARWRDLASDEVPRSLEWSLVVRRANAWDAP